MAKGQGEHPEIWWSARLELAECREARVLAVYLGEDRTAVRSLLWLAHKLQFDDQLNTALAVLDTAEAESRRGDFQAEQAQYAKQRSDCLEWLGLYDMATEADQRALELYTELDDPNQITTVLLSLARLYSHRKCDHATALEYYARCLEYVDRVDPARMCNYAALQGYTLQNCGRYPESVDSFKQAVELARGSAEPRIELMELNSLAAAGLTLNMRAEGEAGAYPVHGTRARDRESLQPLRGASRLGGVSIPGG